MIELGISNYINGGIDLIAYSSTRIGRSSIRVTCFKSDKFINNFSKFYKINKTDVNLDKDHHDANYFLESWLGSKSKINNLVSLIEIEIGEILDIYVPHDDRLKDILSGSEGGLSGFYFVEDIFFISSNKYMVCFILGNNE